MSKLLSWTVLCVMLGKTLQDHQEGAKTNASRPSILGPKTFDGRTRVFNATGGERAPPPPPPLDVAPDSPALSYAAGLLSTRVIPSAYGVAMALGVPANAYVLVFLAARPRARASSMAPLYASLALSDLLLLLSLAPRLHYHLNGNHWVFGEAACRLVTACFYGNVYCSAHAVACASVQRYLAVVRPFLYRRLPRRAWSLGACLAVWGLFGVAVAPELLVRQSYRLAGAGVTTCHDVLPLREPSHAVLAPYRLALVCLGVLAPFLVCAWAHAAVVRRLRRSPGDRAAFVRVSTLVFLIFVVCYAPSGVLHVAHYARLCGGGGDGLYVYYSAAVCLCCFHSCLDPLLCLLMARTAASRPRPDSLRGMPMRTDALG